MKKFDFGLEKKVVLITGGSSYLGTAMCEVLSQYGATLVIVGKNFRNIVTLKKRLLQEYSNPIEVFQMDISVDDSVHDVVSLIIKKFNRIDVLINNANFSSGKDLLDLDYANWNLGIEGTIGGNFRVTREVLGYMVKEKKGKIINISSMYGTVSPDVSIYDGTDFYNPVSYGVGKAGIIQFTKYIAANYGIKGITCNSISPGPFPNEDVKKDGIFLGRLIERVPLKRVGTPDDLKGLILLLTSSNSDFINGVNIPVDGGWTIW